MDDLALAASSGNLALRAIVLWRDKPSVSWTLRSVCVAHLTYAMILGIAGVQGRWVPELETCVLDADAARAPLVAFLAFTILWDLSILLLTVSGMRRVELSRTSPLWSTLATQGVTYAFVALLTCIPIAVLYCLDLNPIMNIILFAPGSTISVVVSSSAVSTLLGMSEASQKGAQSIVPSSRRRSSRRARTADNKTGNMLTTIVHLNESRTSSEVNEPIPLDNIKPSASEDMELGLGSSKR
ncbi:hypothetical protein PsYK624_085890 [Phanerochaete sordida]|uniref:Uncharacterized protein n=1 Tax=Phanerochaete sordida TaxID=48140 RepID=A0A9P3GCZ0_9APHY|nr:hypothetical protein PsYK624_085890 [Phanerochaete sordida]